MSLAWVALLRARWRGARRPGDVPAGALRGARARGARGGAPRVSAAGNGAIFALLLSVFFFLKWRAIGWEACCSALLLLQSGAVSAILRKIMVVASRRSLQRNIPP